MTSERPISRSRRILPSVSRRARSVQQLANPARMVERGEECDYDLRVALLALFLIACAAASDYETRVVAVPRGQQASELVIVRANGNGSHGGSGTTIPDGSLWMTFLAEKAIREMAAGTGADTHGRSVHTIDLSRHLPREFFLLTGSSGGPGPSISRVTRSDGQWTVTLRSSNGDFADLRLTSAYQLSGARRYRSDTTLAKDPDPLGSPPVSSARHSKQEAIVCASPVRCTSRRRRSARVPTPDRQAL